MSISDQLISSRQQYLSAFPKMAFRMDFNDLLKKREATVKSLFEFLRITPDDEAIVSAFQFLRNHLDD